MIKDAIDRSAFHTLSCGLYIVSSVNSEGRRCGCVINTLLQVTSEPPQLLIAINKENFTTSAIEESGSFCAVVLAQSATMDLIGEFGFKTSSEVDKFENFPLETDAQGIPYVTQHAVASFSLQVEQKIDVGSHIIFVALVKEAKKLSDEKPLTYEYYHRVVKGGTPRKASSYDPTTDSASSTNTSLSDTSVSEDELSGPRVGWKCVLCGTIVEGYPDGLPEDFRCPVCGVGREFFQQIEL